MVRLYTPAMQELNTNNSVPSCMSRAILNSLCYLLSTHTCKICPVTAKYIISFHVHVYYGEKSRVSKVSTRITRELPIAFNQHCALSALRRKCSLWLIFRDFGDKLASFGPEKARATCQRQCGRTKHLTSLKLVRSNSDRGQVSISFPRACLPTSSFLLPSLTSLVLPQLPVPQY